MTRFDGHLGGGALKNRFTESSRPVVTISHLASATPSFTITRSPYLVGTTSQAALDVYFAVGGTLNYDNGDYTLAPSPPTQTSSADGHPRIFIATIPANQNSVTINVNLGANAFTAGIKTLVVTVTPYSVCPSPQGSIPPAAGTWNYVVDWKHNRTTFNFTDGDWSDPFDIAVGAIHASLLPTGKVLYWLGYKGNPNWVRVYDPDTGSHYPQGYPAGWPDIFCAGHTLMKDGTVFVAGGNIDTPAGLRHVAAYSPLDNFWTRLPIMNTARWYPSCATLDNGEILIMGGTYATADVAASIDDNALPQLWNPATGQFRDLTAAQKKVRFYPYVFSVYTHLLNRPDDRVFYAGPQLLNPQPGENELDTMRLSTGSSGEWTTLGRLAHHHEHAPAVMF